MALATDVRVQNKTQLAISAEVPSLILIAPRDLDQVRQPTVLQLESRDVYGAELARALIGELLQLRRFGVDACAQLCIGGKGPPALLTPRSTRAAL